MESPPAVSACSGLFCGLCACCHFFFLPAIPNAHQHLAPIKVALPHLFIHVHQDRRLGPAVCRASSLLHHHKQHVCKLRDCPVGSNNAGLQWRPAHRVVFSAPWPVQQDCLQAAASWRLRLGSPCTAAATHKKGRPGTAIGQPAKVPHTCILRARDCM